MNRDMLGRLIGGCSIESGGDVFRSLRWLVVVGAVLGAFQASAAEPCVRRAVDSDVFIDVRGDLLRVVVANTERDCWIGYYPDHRLGAREDVNGFQFRLVGPRGENLARMKGREEYWFVDDEVDRSGDSTVVLLKPGEARVFTSKISSYMRYLSIERRAAGVPDLPWGQEIMIEAEISLLTAIELLWELNDNVKSADAKTPWFRYRLPDRRPD